jgi:uncharacterized repeat protein (TIGR01451 family)
MSRLYRHFSRLIVLVMLLSWLPATPITVSAYDAPQVAANTPADTLQSEVSPAPESQPIPDPHLPELALQVDVAPSPLAVGDTATLSVTITNAAPDPAEDLVVTLPAPDGVLAIPGPGTVSPTQGWQWNVGHVDGQSRTTLTGGVRVVRMPTGKALLLHPQATARGLDPTTTVGGAVVLPQDHGPATVRFTPGAAARLHSRDGRVHIDFPARGFARGLTLRAYPAPYRSTIAPAQPTASERSASLSGSRNFTTPSRRM